MQKLIVYMLVSFSLSGLTTTARCQQTNTELIAAAFVSDDGTLFSYRKIYQGVAKQYVHDRKLDKIYQFQSLQNPPMFNDRYFIGFSYVQKRMYILDRQTALIDTVHEVRSMDWLPETNQVVYHRENDHSLVVRSLADNRAGTFEQVSWFELAPNKDKILFLSHGNQAHVLDVKSRKVWSNVLPDLQDASPKKLIWDEAAHVGYVFAHSADHFYLYSVRPGAASKVFDRPLVDVVSGFMIDTSFSQVLLMANKKIALAEKLLPRKKTQQYAEIWHGSKKGLTPTFDFHSPHQKGLAIIDLRTNALKSFGEPGKWMEFKIDRQDRIYGYEVDELDDFSKRDPDRNVYIYENSDCKQRFLHKFTGNAASVKSFESFPHLVYFMKNEWLYFDVTQNASSSITSATDGKFYDDRYEYYQITDDVIGAQPIPFKSEGFFLGDRDDIWFYDWSSKTMSRRTRGREEQKQYRFSPCNYQSIRTPWSWNMLDASMTEYQDFALTWTAELHKRQGISLLKPDGSLKTLVEDQAIYSGIIRSEGYLLYTKEKASMPPRLYLYDLKTHTETALATTNDWDTGAKHVRSEYFYWKNKDNQLRGGVLRFPKSYKEGENRRYPAIVEIYEKRFSRQQKYVSPQEIEGNAINYRTYTDLDYFVIEPDIYYEIGAPGLSANACVNEAIDHLATLFPIDTNRLGLFGHSFGGYETNFIITQTPRFKAAISSSGVADPVGRYFGFSQDGFRTDMWRYETQQYRMGGSFFEIPEKYIANSPVHQMKHVRTPLLLITGKEDHTVYWEQSISMFLGLKRLGNAVNLLLYPNEDHVLMDPEKRKDASDKMQQWFGHYLKGSPREKWMDPDYSY